MLRPATPLTVLLFVAFILLLISVISTPVVRSIPLASFQGLDFGVFGYCTSGSCSGIKVGYAIGMPHSFLYVQRSRPKTIANYLHFEHRRKEYRSIK